MFFGPMALTTEDPNHGEQRFVTLGADGLGRLLVVVCTWRDDDVIRVMSARLADKKERKYYEDPR